MKFYTITCLLVILLTSIGLADEAKLGDTFALDKVNQFVFVEEVPVGDDFGYEKKKLKGKTKGVLAEALKKVSQQPYITDMDYPFIGILARVMLLDSDGNPICTMQVVKPFDSIQLSLASSGNSQNYCTSVLKMPWELLPSASGNSSQVIASTSVQ